MERGKVISAQVKKMQQKKERYLISFLFVFVLGYLIFFTSKLWMPPDKASVPPTVIGKAVEANERRVTLISWTWDEEKREMEVILEITNTALDGVDTYRWSAMELNKGKIKVKPIIEQESFVVLELSDIPKKFEEISLRMSIKSEDEIKVKEFENIRFYAVKESIKREKIKNLDERGYKRKACLSKIDAYKERIDELKAKIREQEKIVADAKETIKNLEEKKLHQTETEIEETNKAISDVVNKMQTADSKIDEFTNEIEDFNEKIKMQQEVYEGL